MDNKTKLRDELTGALIGLARATDNNADTSTDTWRIMIDALLTTDANADLDEEAIREQIDRVHAEKLRLVPDCAVCTSPCGRTADYDMQQLQRAPEDIRRIKSDILSGVRGLAAHAHRSMTPGSVVDGETGRFFALALFAIGEDWDADELRSVAAELREKNFLTCS
mgnify:FL=1